MTLSQADHVLRRAYYYLYKLGAAASNPDALKLLHQKISQNELERMRAMRSHFVAPSIACIGNGLYIKTGGGR